MVLSYTTKKLQHRKERTEINLTKLLSPKYFKYFTHLSVRERHKRSLKVKLVCENELTVK